MTCPICDQKPMNCDCTDRERRMYRELNDVVELRLTDEEREAITEAAALMEEMWDKDPGPAMVATLRGLLARHDAT